MKVWVSFDVFGGGAYFSMVSGDMDLPALPKVGDRLDLRGGIPALMDSSMPPALEVTTVLLSTPQFDGTESRIVGFEYFDVGSVARAIELCRLLERELGLFCDHLDDDAPEGDAEE